MKFKICLTTANLWNALEFKMLDMCEFDNLDCIIFSVLYPMKIIPKINKIRV